MTIVYSILFFLLGSLFASFFQLLAYRLPKKETILGRSYCTNCFVELSVYEIIPVLGYIINKGHCRYCHEKISVSYFISEILGGALFTVSYLILGINTNLFIAYIMIITLITESVTDIQKKEVVDEIWMIGFILVLFTRAFQQGLTDYIISAIVMFNVLLLLAFIGKRMSKKEVLGGGDIKLYLFIGLILKLPLSFLSIFIASIFGVIYALVFKKKANVYLPLVPFIFLGVLISFFFGQQMIDWYLGLLGM